MIENSTEYNGNIAFFYRNSWYHRKKVLQIDGKTTYTKVGGFKTPKEAEDNYYKCLEEYEEQRRNYCVLIDKEIMLKDYLKYWYENVFAPRVESTSSMIASYAIYNLIIPNIPYDIKVRLVTSDFISQTLDNIDKLGKTIASTGRYIFNLVFKNVVHDGILSHNPVDSVPIYKRGKVNVKILTKDEIKKFLEITCDSDTWYLEILLALFCGLRKGEIRGLKFSDFNIEQKTVKIHRQLSSEYELNDNEFNIEKMNYIEKDPKTENSIRILRVPDIILDELEKRKKIVEYQKLSLKDKYIDNDYVSCQENGLPHGHGSLNAFIEKRCINGGLPKITVHGLRHMYATILIEQGVSIPKISALLGHASIHTTFDFYLSVISEKEKIMAFMNNTFAIEESNDEI